MVGSCPPAVAQPRSGLRLLPMGLPYERRAAAVECPRSDARVAPPRQPRVRHRGESPRGGQDSRCTVRWATELLNAAAAQKITLRAGLHTGEIELRPPDIAVHTANRIADLAGPNEILVSRTVVDLTAGSGLTFEPRGEHQLKGVPGTW